MDTSGWQGEEMVSTMTLELGTIRRSRGISLEQIAEKTKISSHFLRAIECEEYHKLPGGVYNTNYIRQYASAIGVPENALLERYRAYESAVAAEEAGGTPPRRPEPLPARWFHRLRSAMPASRWSA
jgi:cytoskeletal protein RodZ